MLYMLCPSIWLFVQDKKVNVQNKVKSAQQFIALKKVFNSAESGTLYHNIISLMPRQELIANRSGHLCPHSTGKPLKTIVGCWGFLNSEPHRQNLVLAGSCVKAQYRDVSSKGWMNWKPSTGIALHPKSFVNWTVTSCGVSEKTWEFKQRQCAIFCQKYGKHLEDTDGHQINRLCCRCGLRLLKYIVTQAEYSLGF